MPKRVIAIAVMAISLASSMLAGRGRVGIVREPVKDEYLVWLEDGDRRQVPGLANALARAHGGRLIEVWNEGIQGFWVSMPPAEAEALLHDPHVRAVEQNAVMHVSSQPQSVGGTDPFWHLDRIDQRSATLDQWFQYCTDRVYEPGVTPAKLRDVYAFVFDSGVLSSHPDLSGRVEDGPNFGVDPAGNNTGDQPPPYSDASSFSATNPCGAHNSLRGGHGTAVGTVLGGTSLGVARTVRVVPVRIENCSGQSQNANDDKPEPLASGSLISALNWLFGSTTYWSTSTDKSLYPAVANFSFHYDVGTDSGEYFVEQMIQRLVRGGVVVVASANNGSTTSSLQDGALNSVPSRLSYSNPATIFTYPERVITVGGTMRTSSGADARWYCDPSVDAACNGSVGSNYGRGIDIWAPAHNIQTGHHTARLPGTGDPWTGTQYRRPTYFGSTDGYSSPLYGRSGTSFSAPLVAGAAAQLLAHDASLWSPTNPSATPVAVWNRIKAEATRLDATAADLGANSPNLFLYVPGVTFSAQPADSTVNSGATATVSATAVGSNVTYQLYEGASGVTTTPVGSAQSSGTFQFTATATKSYWIRASCTCAADGGTVTGDSAAATVTVNASPPPPPNIVAISNWATSVTVGWLAVNGATGYKVFRSSDNGPYTVVATVNGLSYDDTAVVAGKTYLYKVQTLAGSVASAFSNVDLATTVTFTDDYALSGATIRGLHLDEIRAAVNSVRAAAGMATVSYSAASGQPVRATDITDLRAALVAAYAVFGMTAPAFNESIGSGSTVKAAHYQEIRNAVR